jgi:hypothetical protein
MSDRPFPGALPTGATFGTTTMVSEGAHIHRRISWAAIFGGVILVVVLQLLLSTLGVGVGFGTVNVNAGTSPDAGNLGLGAVSGGSSAVVSLCFSEAMLQPGWPALRFVLMAFCTGLSAGALPPF